MANKTTESARGKLGVEREAGRDKPRNGVSLETGGRKGRGASVLDPCAHKTVRVSFARYLWNTRAIF